MNTHFQTYEGPFDLEKAKYDYPKSFIIIDEQAGKIQIFNSKVAAEQYKDFYREASMIIHTS